MSILGDCEYGKCLLSKYERELLEDFILLTEARESLDKATDGVMMSEEECWMNEYLMRRFEQLGKEVLGLLEAMDDEDKKTINPAEQN